MIDSKRNNTKQVNSKWYYFDGAPSVEGGGCKFKTLKQHVINKMVKKEWYELDIISRNDDKISKLCKNKSQIYSRGTPLCRIQSIMFQERCQEDREEIRRE